MTVRAEHLDGDRYRVRIYAGRDPVTGKARQLTRTFRAKNQRTADKQSSLHEAELRRKLEAKQAQQGTVAELVESWQSIRTPATHSPTTLYREAPIVRRIVERLGAIPLDDLNGRHIDEWHAWLRTLDVNGRRLSEATVHHHFRVLRSILITGEHWQMVATPATKHAKVPKPEKRELRLPTRQAIDVLISTLPPHARFPIIAASQTGVRRGELFGLRLDAIDWEQRKLSIRANVVEVPGRPLVDKIPKGKRTRPVPFGGGFAAILETHIATLRAASPTLAADAFVMADLAADPTGRTPLRPGWLSLLWKRHTTRHGVQCRLHDLRHYYGSSLIAAGVTAKAVQEALGHADMSTTNIYIHALEGSDDSIRTAADALMPGSAP